MEVTFLGTGSSTGTPVIGCDCLTCTSSDPRNKRTRCSIAVQMDTGETLLVDTGPDLRLQALRENILRVDGVLYTHTHADHLNGIDDLRNFCFLQKQPIPVFGNDIAIHDIRQRFSYAFAEPGQHWDKPVLTAQVVENVFELAGVEITPIPVMHGKLPILGYRINNMAYITDVSHIPDSSMPLLEGLDLLMLDCLHYRPHPTHIHFDKSLEYAFDINAKETFLIHMTHQMEFSEVSSRLPSNIHLSYDGLRLKL